MGCDFSATVTNHGTIASGTFGAVGGDGNISYSDGAYLWFGGSVSGNSLTINSGTFSGESIFFGDSGVFSGSVTNNASGTIANGTYSGSVTNYGTICPGTTPAFTGSFDWQGGTIGGSGNTADFSGLTGNLTIGSGLNWDFGTASVGTSGSTVTNNGTISAGTFNGTTTNNWEINGGSYYGAVVNDNVINAGDFHGSVANNGTITNGTFYVTSRTEAGGTINGGYFIYDWLGSASGDVTDESNWEMSVVPGEGVTAWIGGSPNYWPDSGTCD
jgi:hypothetical protein